jgi:hypothetical protein
VYRERQFLRLCRHTRIMGRRYQWRGTVGESQHWQRSSYTEKDCFEKSHNYCSTGEGAAELNIHLEDPVSTKTVRRDLHQSNIHSKAAIAKPLITGSNARMRKRWCHDHKTWTSGNCKRARDMVRWVVLHAVPYIRKGWHLENTQGSLQSEMPGSNSETLGRFCDGLGSNIVIQYSVGPIITSWMKYCKGVHGQVW